jgi:hypothetical protein
VTKIFLVRVVYRKLEGFVSIQVVVRGCVSIQIKLFLCSNRCPGCSLSIDHCKGGDIIGKKRRDVAMPCIFMSSYTIASWLLYALVLLCVR